MLNVVQDFHQGCVGVGAEHGYACFAEVGDAFEQRRCRQMPADVEYAAILVYAVDALGNLPVDEGEFRGYGRFGGLESESGGFERAEYPWRTDRCSPHHHAVDTVAVEGIAYL